MTVESPEWHRDRDLCAWLIDGDPSIRWQVMADLFHAPAAQVREERARVASEGWGARLLAAQDDDGRWAGALYSPKWTSTTYTLLLLERLGLESGNDQALAGCRVLWDSATWFEGGLTLAKTVRQPETCITGMLVYLAASFGLEDPRINETVDWLLNEQLPDGGWNCDTVRTGSSHGSFHTTITVLEALQRWQKCQGSKSPRSKRVGRALGEGQQFFLVHHLYRSHKTGEVVDRTFTRFPFPPQWHFDVVRGLEHFRAANADPDDRLLDAVSAVRLARRTDGTWPMYRPYAGRHWFRMESRGPSRWSTFRALRVLDWWSMATKSDVLEEDDQPATSFEWTS